MRRHIVLLFCACLSAPVFAATEVPAFDLLKAMSAADFRATGLDHLSDAQLKALSAWFAEHQGRNGSDCSAAAAGETPKAAAATSTSAATEDTISSYISGSFKGFREGARYTLDNGQVWEQTDDTAASISPITHPKATIRAGAFNAFYLTVEGAGDSVMVRRVNP